MRTRQEIKAIGKSRFQANYWTCVLAVLLVSIVLGGIMGISFGPSYAATITASLSGSEPELSGGAAGGAFLGYIAIFVLAGPLNIGLAYFFVMNVLGRDDLVSVSTPFKAAFTNFGRKLGGYLWMGLFIFLWALLLYIPGIIKAYSYAMTPYILGDCPNVKAKDALKLSKRIMKGHKWELFVLQLSFIGWMILNSLTFNLLEIFYVGPYMQSTYATYYLEVREDALRRGVITMGQLEGREAV